MKSVSSGLICLFHGLFLLLAVVLVYCNTLDSPFVLDDSQIFENNYTVISDWSWTSLKKISSSRFHPQRFFPNLSFAINYNLNGHNVTGYHWGNIGVHSLTALAVYFLLNVILSLVAPGNEPRLNRELAFLAALLWAVHPLQTNAVTYIIQRMTSMAALFYLMSVLCYLKARLRKGFVDGWLLYLLAALFGIMALYSKENTAILPVMILGCELFFLQDIKGGKLFAKRNILFGSLFLGGFLLIGLALLGRDPLARIMDGYQYRDFTIAQRLLTEPRVIFSYLALLFFPLPSRLNIAYDYPLSTGLLSPPQTLFAIIGLVGLAVLVVILFRRHRLTSFAIFWFLVNLAIESSFLPLMIIFEHRMYLPSIMLICTGVVWWYRLFGNKIQLARWTVIGVIVLFSFFTWQRNTVWRSELSLWSDVVAKSPGLAWGHSNLGKVYAESGEYDLAESHLKKAIALDPDFGLGYLNLGVMYYKQNRPHDAFLVLNKALEVKIGDHARLYRNLAIVNAKLGKMDEAIRYANLAIEKRPWRYNGYDTLASIYLKIGNYRQAETVIREAIELFPQKGDPYVRLAEVYEKQNRLSQALDLLEWVFTLRDVNLAQAYNHLGIVYWRMKNLSGSIEAAQKALEIDPTYLDAYLTLGISYEDSGQMDLAFSQFNKGWQRGLDMVRIYNDWALYNIRNNNPDRAIVYLQQAVNLEPGQVESHKNLARAYSMKGMRAEAALEEKKVQQLSFEEK